MKIVLDDGAMMPIRMHEDDAGMDFLTPNDFVIPPRGYCKVNLGVHVQVPCGHYGKMESRSGMMANGVITMGGVIDPNYTGSISVCLYNFNDFEMKYYRGDRVTQMVVVPYLAVYPEPSTHLDETRRGDKGFGSTGV